MLDLWNGLHSLINLYTKCIIIIFILRDKNYLKQIQRRSLFVWDTTMEALATFRFLAPASLILSFSFSCPFHLHPRPPPQTLSLPRSLRSLTPSRSPHCRCHFPSCCQSLTLKGKRFKRLSSSANHTQKAGVWTSALHVILYTMPWIHAMAQAKHEWWDKANPHSKKIKIKSPWNKCVKPNATSWTMKIWSASWHSPMKIIKFSLFFVLLMTHFYFQ